jgi:hypothetical protein
MPDAAAASRRTAARVHVRRNLLQQFQPFPGQTVFERQKTSDVTAWPRQACNIPGAYWIDDIDEHNRHIVDQL